MGAPWVRCPCHRDLASSFLAPSRPSRCWARSLGRTGRCGEPAGLGEAGEGCAELLGVAACGVPPLRNVTQMPPAPGTPGEGSAVPAGPRVAPGTSGTLHIGGSIYRERVHVWGGGVTAGDRGDVGTCCPLVAAGGECTLPLPDMGKLRHKPSPSARPGGHCQRSLAFLRPLGSAGTSPRTVPDLPPPKGCHRLLPATHQAAGCWSPSTVGPVWPPDLQ